LLIILVAFVGVGVQYREEDDSFTEGDEGEETVAESLPNIGHSKKSRKAQSETSRDVQSRKAPSETTRDVQCQALPMNIVSDVSVKKATSEGTAGKCVKIDSSVREKRRPLNSDTATDRTRPVITSDIHAAQIPGKLCDDDVNLNRQANKPSIVKGVLNIITPEQDTAMGALDATTPKQDAVVGALDATTPNRETVLGSTTPKQDTVLLLDATASKQDSVAGVLDATTPEQDTVVSAVDATTPKQGTMVGALLATTPKQDTIRVTSDVLDVQDSTMGTIGHGKLELD
jgi:hypothetical protein